MQTNLKKYAYIITFALFAFVAGCNKYAVLISTNEVVADNSMIHSEWWYDLVLQYQMLKENGFTDDKIYVLYGSGVDFNTAYPEYNATTLFGHSITDMAVNKANIQATFTALGGEIKKNDHLYVWWMGHGGGSGPGSCNLSMLISNTGETVTDAELSTYINSVGNYKKRTVAVMTCHSGGIVDNMDISGSKTVTLASSTCAQSSYDASSTCDGIFHAEFNYTLPNALRIKDSCGSAVASDTNGNSYVSLSETHQYNMATMTTSAPQMGDPDGISSSTSLKVTQP